MNTEQSFSNHCCGSEGAHCFDSGVRHPDPPSRELSSDLPPARTAREARIPISSLVGGTVIVDKVGHPISSPNLE